MNINNYIEQTLLKQDTKLQDIEALVLEAKKYHIKSICINPIWVKLAKEKIEGADIKIVTVVDFPLGSSNIKTKIMSAINAIEDGADEIDMVINIGMFKNGNYKYLQKEINDVKNAIGNKILKIIIETSLLSNDEIKTIAQEVAKSKADYIKTSTGFGTRGASLLDIETIDKNINGQKKIKASGGIKTFQKAKEMIEMGASKIGTSAGIKIIKEAKKYTNEL